MWNRWGKEALGETGNAGFWRNSRLADMLSSEKDWSNKWAIAEKQDFRKGGEIRMWPLPQDASSDTKTWLLLNLPEISIVAMHNAFTDPAPDFIYFKAMPAMIRVMQILTTRPVDLQTEVRKLLSGLLDKVTPFVDGGKKLLYQSTGSALTRQGFGRQVFDWALSPQREALRRKDYEEMMEQVSRVSQSHKKRKIGGRSHRKRRKVSKRKIR